MRKRERRLLAGDSHTQDRSACANAKKNYNVSAKLACTPVYLRDLMGQYPVCACLSNLLHFPAAGCAPRAPVLECNT